MLKSSGIKNPDLLKEAGDAPIYWRVPECARKTGLSRSAIYDGMTIGKIRYKHLVRPGNKKGIRIVECRSVLEWIDELAREGVKTR